MASVSKHPAALPKWFWLASLLGCTPGFKKSRCKKLLKVTMSRIKLLRGRREVQVRQLRRDVAQLLQLGQEENAESRLDRLWKEHSLLSAYIKTGEYCQFVKANLRNIAGQRECPMDLKESLASLCFAASCCADLPELQEIRDIMVMKYGKGFLTSAQELLPGEHVNKLFLEAFSTKQPLEVSKKALLKGIIAEYNVVQPKKPKLPGFAGGLQKTGSSHKQQSKHGCGSNLESCKQEPNLDALEQEEKHNKTPKQIRHTTRTCGAFSEEHASLPHVEGDQERTMPGQHKKEEKGSHFLVDRVQGGVNETDLGSQDRILRALPHERYGKEKFRNRLKLSKKNARVNQAGPEDQHTSSIRMSIYEKSEPDEAASEVIHGLHGNGNTANEKPGLDKEVKGFVSGQHWVQEHSEFYGYAKHLENKPSNKGYLAETKQQVLIAQPWKNRYLDETLSEDCNTHQILQQGKVRLERIRQAFDSVEHEKEQCHMDSNHAETRSKHHSRSNRKDRCTDEFDDKQREKSPRRRNHHMEGGTKVKIVHRFDKTLRPAEAAYGIGYWQSTLIGNGILPEEREPPHVDSNYGQTKHKHKSRSNGKSRPDRVTNEVDNNQQERSPYKRSHQVEGGIGYEKSRSDRITNEVKNNQQERSPCKRSHQVEGGIRYEKSRPDRVTNEVKNNQQERSPCKRSHQVEGGVRFEKSRPGKEANEIENWMTSPKGNEALPYYNVDTHEVQTEKGPSLNKSHENAHVSQKGRKEHVRKHHFEETQQEAWADYSESVKPERTTNESLNSHNNADDDSNYPARQRERNLHSHPTEAKIERDLQDAKQNGYALEPCMDGKTAPGERGHVRQKHRRVARKHDSGHANSIVKILDGATEGKQERSAEEGVNGQTHWLCYANGPHVPEDDSNCVAQRERAHFPQWHHQFDAKPKGCEGSIAVEARSLHNANGTQKEQKHHEGLDEHEDLIAKLSSCERVKGNLSPSRFSEPPQRPPPPVPPCRVSSLPNRKPVNSPLVLPHRCATLETGHVRVNQEPHVHPKLPEYEDLVASFAALRNKPARPSKY